MELLKFIKEYQFEYSTQNEIDLSKVSEAIKNFEMAIPLGTKVLNSISITAINSFVLYMRSLKLNHQEYNETIIWVNKLNHLYHRAVFANRFTQLEKNFAKDTLTHKSELQTVFTLQEYLDVSPSAFTNFRKGKNLPSTENLMKIATYYNVRLEYLINLDTISNLDSDNLVSDSLGLSVPSIKVLQLLIKSAKTDQFSRDYSQKMLNTLNLILESFNEADTIAESILNTLSEYLSYDPDNSEQFAIVDLNIINTLADNIIEDFNEGVDIKSAIENRIGFESTLYYKKIEINAMLLSSLTTSLFSYQKEYSKKY